MLRAMSAGSKVNFKSPSFELEEFQQGPSPPRGWIQYFDTEAGQTYYFQVMSFFQAFIRISLHWTLR